LFTAADSAPQQYPKDWLELWRTRIGIAIFLFGWSANQHADYVLRHLRDDDKRKKGARSDVHDKARKDGSESEKTGAAGEAGASEAVRRRYKIPYGGLFRWTSAANYTGEIIEWGGWALAANSAPATSVPSFLHATDRRGKAARCNSENIKNDVSFCALAHCYCCFCWLPLLLLLLFQCFLAVYHFQPCSKSDQLASMVSQAFPQLSEGSQGSHSLLALNEPKERLRLSSARLLFCARPRAGLTPRQLRSCSSQFSYCLLSQDAIDQLSVSANSLCELQEQGQLRASCLPRHRLC
jgi:hypothetical protein